MANASTKAEQDLKRADISALGYLDDALAVIDEKRPFYNAITRRVFGDKFDNYVDKIEQYRYFVTAGGDPIIAKRRQSDPIVAPKVKDGARKILRAVIAEEPIDISSIIKSASATAQRVAGEAFSDVLVAGKQAANDAIDVVKPTASGLIGVVGLVAAVFILINLKRSR